MLDKINLFGITVVNNNIVDIPVATAKEKAIWAVVLVLITVVCLIVSRYTPDVKKTLADKNRERKNKKVAAERDAELARLHKIKELNKRK